MPRSSREHPRDAREPDPAHCAACNIHEGAISGASVSSTIAVERQLLREPPNLPRALEREIAAETKMHALRDECLSLLETAVERMRDAAFARRCTRKPLSTLSCDLRTWQITGRSNSRASLQLFVVEELLARIVETVGTK